MSFADVESANIVGYSTYTAVKGFNLCAVNFKNIGESEAFPIINLFPDIGSGVKKEGLSYGGSIATGADYMMVSKGPGSTDYNMYYLYYNSKTGGSNNYKWFDASSNKVLTDATTIKNGDAFWFVKQSDGTVDLPVSGEVELAASKSVTIKEGFNLIGSFFPAGFAPNDEPYTTSYWKDTVKAIGGGSVATGADYFMVSKGPGSTDYDMYYLFYNSKTGGTNNYKWYDASKNKAATGNILPPGRGMWFVRQGKGEITFEIKKQF